MSGLRATAALLVLGSLALAAAARPEEELGPARRKAAYPTQFAAGEGRDIAAQRCMLCHSAMLVTQQAKDSTGWEKTLAQMEKWSAPLEPGQHRTLHRYLLRYYGPRR